MGGQHVIDKEEERKNSTNNISIVGPLDSHPWGQASTWGASEAYYKLTGLCSCTVFPTFYFLAQQPFRRPGEAAPHIQDVIQRSAMDCLTPQMLRMADTWIGPNQEPRTHSKFPIWVALIQLI